MPETTLHLATDRLGGFARRDVTVADPGDVARIPAVKAQDRAIDSNLILRIADRPEWAVQRDDEIGFATTIMIVATASPLIGSRCDGEPHLEVRIGDIESQPSFTSASKKVRKP